MDSQLNIAISGIPNKLSDLPLDVSIMCAELLQNTLQSTGLNRNVQIVRTIGAKIFSHAIDTALSNNCRVHILFSVQHCQESYFDNPLPLLSTLQHRGATVYNFLLERFAFNNVAARSKLLAPNANIQLAGHLARSFEHSCDTAAVSLGTYSNQAQLNQIHRYAPAVARATATTSKSKKIFSVKKVWTSCK